MALLRSKGFNGCGVQEIADAAGVPKGSFYNYFESKESFSVEVLEHYWRQRVAKPLAALRDESATPLERLRAYFAQQAKTHAAGHYATGCLIGNLAAEIAGQSQPVRDKLAGLFAQWAAALASCLREAQQAGEIAPASAPEAVASFLLNAWQGAVMRAKVERNANAFEAFARIRFSELLESRPAPEAAADTAAVSVESEMAVHLL